MSEALIELKDIPPIAFHRSSTLVGSEFCLRIEAMCGGYFLQGLISETSIRTARRFGYDAIKDEQYRIACELVKAQIYGMETRSEE